MANNVFSESKWIWCEREDHANTYAEFCFDYNYLGQNTVLNISCDSDYTLFVNGKYFASNQYGDFEYYKSYDSFSLKDVCVRGKNTFAVLVWYFGENSMRYLSAPAGLIFEITENGVPVLKSDENILSRKSYAYKNGKVKKITGQLGFSFEFDATKNDGFPLNIGDGFAKSFIKNKICNFVPRPVKKSVVECGVPFEILTPEKCGKARRFVIDLKKEIVGLFTFSFIAESKGKVVVSYGEDLQNGTVRRFIGSRDFSFSIVYGEGKTEYTNYMLRLACRYIVLEFDTEVVLNYATLLPQIYPLEERRAFVKDPLLNNIYQISVNTLKLCAMEHYVDCPWREQCLYAFDSRNQMLCGYYAFKDGNKDYAAANLKLFSLDGRKDWLLSICTPCGCDFTIPSFSLYYVLACTEYARFSHDFDFIKNVVFDKIAGIIDAFTKKVRNGLAEIFSEPEHWNFYDWSDGAAGKMFQKEESLPDFMINALTIIALDCFEYLCDMTGKPYTFRKLRDNMVDSVNAAFYNAEKGLYSFSAGIDDFTELVNAFAVYSGIATGAVAEKICDVLVKNILPPCSLSMKIFTYDALMKTDTDKYRDYIISQIKDDYGEMVAQGSSCVWEVKEGASAYDNAGSLCHGWSAVPVYVFNKLGIVRYE